MTVNNGDADCFFQPIDDRIYGVDNSQTLGGIFEDFGLSGKSEGRNLCDVISVNALCLR